MRKVFFLISTILSFQIWAQKPTIANSEKATAKAPVVSSEQLAKQHQKAAEFVSFDTSCGKEPNTPLEHAARATAQIVHKSLVQVRGDHIHIDSDKTEWCAGHPLAGANGSSFVKIDKSNPEAVKTSKKSNSPRPCSGFLVGDQQTVGTSGHCIPEGMNSEKFCSEFAFVFNRACGKSDFTKDEIQECESGKIVEEGVRVEEFNLHSDKNAKDHAFFRLKRPVPSSIASALRLRTQKVVTGSSEQYHALGHPSGAHRTIHPLKAFATKAVSDQKYCYAQFLGIVYGGNSGGPLVDSSGDLVGILSSSDDKKFGPPPVSTPAVFGPNGKICQTQIADAGRTTEAVGFCSEVKADLAEVQNPKEQPKRSTSSGSTSTHGVD